MDAREFEAAMAALAETLGPAERAAVCRFAAALAKSDGAELEQAVRRRREIESSWELEQLGDVDTFRAGRA